MDANQISYCSMMFGCFVLCIISVFNREIKYADSIIVISLNGFLGAMFGFFGYEELSTIVLLTSLMSLHTTILLMRREFRENGRRRDY